MDDTFLVGVLDRGDHVEEEFEPLPDAELMIGAVFGDRRSFHQLHHEVRPPAVGRTAIVNPGDVRVVHQGKGLPFHLEAGQHLAGVHAELDDLQRDHPAHRFLLLGHPHAAEAALADHLAQPVAADPVAGVLRRRLAVRHQARLQERVRREVGLDQRFDLAPQPDVASASPFEEARALRGILELEGPREEEFEG